MTLKECVENARRRRRLLRVQLEIIDPTDEALCKEYAQFRSSLASGPDGTGEVWTLERTRKESFATILAACWYRQHFDFLTIEVGLSRIWTTFRWDLSSRCVLMTQEDPASQTLMFEKGKPYYDAYSRELVASFKQAQQVHIERRANCSSATNRPSRRPASSSPCWNWNFLTRSPIAISPTSSARPSGPRTPIRDRSWTTTASIGPYWAVRPCRPYLGGHSVSSARSHRAAEMSPPCGIL